MADFPYFMTSKTVLTASGAGTFTFQVPNNESYDIIGVRQTATGAFVITDMRNSGGQHYTNASSSAPLPDDYFQDLTENNLQLDDFPQALHLAGGDVFYVDMLDTSGGGNTVVLVFSAIRHTGQG